MSIAVGTIVRPNYLPFARVAAASLHRHHPELRLVTVVVGEDADRHADEPFEVLGLDDLAIDDLRRWRFRYDPQQITVAAKPQLLRHMLAHHDAALFIDADVLVLAPLSALLSKVEHHAVVLSPHLTEPLAGAGDAERELNILTSGVFNGGVIGVSGRPEGLRFLDWWQDRLRRDCRHARQEGLHFDQTWLDLVPGLFRDVHVDRDPAFNVAHWNLPERLDELRQGRAALLHFSGFRVDAPDTITRHSGRLEPADVGEARAVFDAYAAALTNAGAPVEDPGPEACTRFDNGIAISTAARAVYAGLDDHVAAGFGDPFETAPAGSFYRWLQARHPECVGGRRSTG
ncbi:MAG: hypothetical protein ACJ762_05195 [Solirubrobacteraceae bacterium]